MSQSRPATVPPPIPPSRGGSKPRPARVPDPSSTTMPLSPEDILSQHDVDLEVERTTRPIPAPRREPSHERDARKER
jgi:hypothetical protein